MIVSTTMLLLVLQVVQVMVVAGDCSEFHPAACPLSEDNIVGYNNSVPRLSDCQDRCGELSDCNFFTHYGSTCYHLSSCQLLVTCQDCISGPPTPPFTSCPWPPPSPTDLPPTTITTTTTTTTGDECDEILTDSVCYMDDTNIITTQHDMTVGQCQDQCQANPDCTWFVWYTHQTYLTFCWLLRHCQAFEPCTGCVCGPGSGPDVDTCIDTPTTTTTSTTITTTPTTITTTNNNCGVFSEAACDIDETNTLGVKHHLTVGECQDTCTASPLCHYFTWYPSLAMQGTCWLLDHCSRQEPCPYCVSGPGGSMDVDDCVSTASTAPTTPTTSTGQSTSTSTRPGGCEVFSSATCDIDEDNNLEVVHDVMVTMCQTICRDNSACNYFTWSNVYGVLGTCWLLDHCNNTEPCSSCISGPADGVDVGSC